MSDKDPGRALAALLEVMRLLRDPQRGCPWDRAQDFASIRPHTLEEAYEVADAIDRQDWPALRDELGDLLFQIVFYARLAEERGWFDFADVATGIQDKLMRRHPHVFAADASASHDSASLHRAWEQNKADERAATGHFGALAGVALALPALTRAAKLGKRAGRVGFDWPDAGSVANKVHEEFAELSVALQNGDTASRDEEFGDLLFALTQYARHLGLDAEAALRAANAKFERRFAAMETALEREGRRPQDCTPEQWDVLWNMVKTAQ